uniref:Polyketide synthase-nonribosomal peptide synthetase ffsA n=1 Tax=Aspergillus flavipes TaxID=41900 RepID=FFSA_ASPFV|nr:RecName: Full=Polyketide synthase-nonribosomal peptide synthetase ffsA; Short=PKS-NRPS ffsA; AltName: Full=Cytochalasans biosynthesis cluster protein ffsA [Aspergillus flavipes]QOG08944.1 FfsA [Aspergillus flavipes]
MATTTAPTTQGHNQPSREPIAIVGSACRFPGGASSPSKLWKLLEHPRDVLKEIPPDRFSVDGFYHPDNMHHGTSNVRHSYILDDDIRVFDAQFFGIKPVEANSIDPQQRLLMETVYEGIESAGLQLNKMKGSQTGVYVGLMSNDYADMLGNDQESFPTYFATGTARSIVSNRVSYFFDWHGPSMTIDTACSSSLVAMHQAVQYLRSGDGSDVAIAAGTNILLNPDQYIAESKLKMLSPDGRSQMWDEKANGYARGDGIAVVVLKTLSQALRDGDHIECIVRETHINQDGKTKGITMPSATAQTALIRSTYKNAGLDITKPSDRPQFFEAHGTGTPAGDPIEAEAIHTAFFGYKGLSKEIEPLSVGSIKTIIGHTEGTAGLAAVLKASLALQAGVIPPNLLFDKVNPKVKPFYGNLQIQTQAKSWPSLAPGAVRRASVNSFGFGGANAHAILEAYEPSSTPTVGTPANVFTALNVSAMSETALRGTLKKYVEYLKEEPSVDLRSLALTVNTRRSTFPVRTSVFGTSVEELSQRLSERSEAEGKTLTPVAPTSLSSSPKILGVFTGQGAQWKQMGAVLLATSPRVVAILDQLEKSLAELPDGPSWSIKGEILADEDSRVNEAVISQPLCTAVQIVLVDLLQSAGVQFHTVVGHSSGEIGAAYAAGYLSASDAIRIAYYRGLHLYLAQGPNGQQGAMMAVGTSFEDAQELCDLPAFRGRISIAASNSSASVTLSGDLNAIEWAKDVFDDEKKFARLLKVDKAYHSHHMLACSDAYRKSMTDCGITVLQPARNGTTWISSVYGEDALDYRHEMNAEYWISNMVSPVLFSQAIEFAMADQGPFDIGIECGPHPALKGPALQVIQEMLGSSIPYTGLLSRGRPDTQALAEGISYLWQALGADVVNYTSFDRFIAGPDASEPQVLANLPSYAWDHDRAFWHESRQYWANRTKEDPPHEILGTKCPDGTDQQHRWRNMLRPREIPWIAGHQIQEQMVFPAAGYVSAAIEAVQMVTRGQSLGAIEIEDFVIGQAIAFNDEYASVETQFTLTDISVEKDIWSASFFFYSASPKSSRSLDLNASGKLKVTLGEPKDDFLPPHLSPEFNMIDVDSERFYDALKKLGFGYTGPFKALGSLKRRMGVATGTITNPTSTDPAHDLLLHPATFDNAIQSIILAYCYPNDGRLWSVQLPTGIKKIKINPVLCNRYAGKKALLCFKASTSDDRSAEIGGDVDIYDEQGNNALMQLEGLQTKPLANATAANDSPLFLETIWDIESPSREAAVADRPDMQPKTELSFDVERVAFFYLRHLDSVATREEREKAESHHKIFFEYIDHTVANVKSGTAQFAKREWMYDTHDEILDIISKYPDSLDMKLMHAVGEHLLPVIRGETTMLEYMREDNLLNDFYVHAIGFDEYTENLAQQVSQFSHRYPHMNILEIGAGTGGATKRIFSKLGKRFGSYTYTDISAGFFEKTRETFREYEHMMTFKALNIEKDPVEQGFTEQSYDLVVASLVLHATHEMETTMRNVRRLLKPGGYLIMLELGDYIEMRTGLIFGSLPGWWMGYDDGRKLSPCMSEEDWSVCMQKTGFSGVDAIVPRQSELPISLAVLTGQAVDDHVNFLRDPLTPGSIDFVESNLTIIGGTTSKVSAMVEEAAKSLGRFYEKIVTATSLAELDTTEVPFMGSVLFLTDLDEPIFENVTEDALTALKQLFKQSRTCLWVTQGARDDNPFQNMSVGLGRVVKLEMTHLRLQSLDFDVETEPSAPTIMQRLLQFEAMAQWEQSGESKDLLWSVEPEIGYDHGKAIIPRLMPNPVRNARYNSSRRLITKYMEPTSANLSLRWSGKSYDIHEGEPSGATSLVMDGRVQLEVSHSTLDAIGVTATDYAYLVLGKNVKSQQQVIALTPKSDSIVRVFDSWTVPYSMAEDDALRLLPVVYTNLMALSVISRLSSGETLVLVEPEEAFAQTLSRLATERAISVVTLTSRMDVKNSDWIYLHVNSPKRLVRSTVPRNASWVIADRDQGGLAANVLQCLPANCKILATESLTSKQPKLDTFSSMAFIPSILRTAFVRAHDIKATLELPSVVAAADISSDNQPSTEATFFSWTASPSVPVQVTPVDHGTLFSSEKTYWLVGLSGGLGLSLCDWMVKHGAKYIVITSRNPQVDARWEQHMKAQGAVVRVYANDITDRESVSSVCKKIRDELPPVGGIAQGAMVLADTMFVDMDLPRVQKVVGPKVNGSIHLHEMFVEVDLEFFVFFSSMAYVTGNQGQSIYAAANAYMTALAAQRRKRGLAGSAINIGTIIGNGYVTRQLTIAQQEYLTHMGNVFMSEQDFHQIFAEAVVAGRPTSKDIPEIMTGLRLAHLDDSDKVTWFHNPKFSHCVLWPEEQGGKAVMSKQNVTVRAQLLLATTADEAREIIEESLAAKLRSSLQIDATVSVINMNADQLGLDSLVAVDIRSWFIKELNVEMPVLKILGGYTVAEMVAAAQEKLSPSLIPNLGKEVDPSLKAVVKAQVEKPVAAAEEKPIVTEKAEYADFDDENEEEGIPTEDSLPEITVSDESSELSDREPAKFNFNGPGFKKVGFSPGPQTPLSEDDRSKWSSYGSPFDSDSDNASIRKSRTSAATSVTALDEYFSKPDHTIFERTLPMSFGQTRFWFLKFYMEDQTTFNITTSISLAGKLDVGRFSRAVHHLGRRHEALRTAFFTDSNNQPMQAVLKEPVLRLEHARGEANVASEYRRIKNHQYDIGRGETMKITLLSLSEKLHQLIIGYHHINMDGISLEVIIRDLQQLYDGKSLAPVSIQYPDFSIMQYKEHSSGQWDDELTFWKSEFADIPEPLPILPPSTKAVRTPLSIYSSNTVKFEVGAELSSQIENACKRTKTSPFNFYLATFKVLLYRLAEGKATDICIGMADGGRNNDLVSQSVGFFLNLLPLRFKQQSSQMFSDALKEARSKVITALANSKVPFDVLLNEVNAPRTATLSPLFQAFINYRQGVQEKRQFCGCESEATKFDGSQTAYDLSLDILGNPGSGIVYLAGQSSLYSQSDVETIAQSYYALLKAFAKNPALRISRPSLYDPQAVDHALAKGKGPTNVGTWPETLVHRVDEIVKAHGSKVALKSATAKLTYTQMAERVNAIASTLQSNGINKCSRVGVFQDPSTDFFCTILAVLRIGAVFVPLEPRLTAPRLATMVQDSDLNAIVYDKANQKTLAELGSNSKKINVSLVLAKSSAVVSNQATPGATAIILYTSGSTGKPKGILLSHSAWRNQIESSSRAWEVPTGTGVHLQQSSWSFDISISQTFVALANGASLIITPKTMRGDSSAITKTIVSDQVTHVQATPSELSSWLRFGDLAALRASKWQFAMTGGERMTPALIDGFRKLAKNDLKLFNAYGPAETTLAVGSSEVDYMTSDDLDTPFTLFPNYSVYILDGQKQPVPAGIPGEVYIGGAGVAQGYLNQDSLTAKRFLPDTFGTTEYTHFGWTKMHRSGDRGHLSEDGHLVLEGRIDGDTQVKLRGIRIDLQDIESAMVQQANGALTEAVVSVCKLQETEYLVAHVVISPTFTGNTESFLDQLRASLPVPQYMQPAIAVTLDALPVNHSGKVDRKAIAALPILPKATQPGATSQPRDSTEKLKDIWTQVLGQGMTSLHHIDAQSDFFHVGGSSLALVEVQAKIKTIFQVEVSLVQLFENPTLGAMARMVDPTAFSAPVNANLTIPAEVATAISAPTTSINTAPKEIDWEEETALTDDFYDIEIDPTPKDQGLPYKTVVITGATGFLGKALLRRMLDDNHIDKIHAITLRRSRSDLPGIFSDPKVHLHRGDLNAPRLGLSETAAAEIFAETDAVIHNGADVSFMKTYRTLSKTNVGSTRELVKLCLPHRIPIHYISSASVVHLSGLESYGEASVSSFEPPQDGTDGYTASKWASERFLERVSEKFSVPIWIHRPSSITGEDAPTLDLMTNMLSFSKKLRKAPTSPAWQGTLDFVDVEKVATEIVEEVKNDSAHPGGLVKYMYESGDLEIAVDDMKGSLERETGQAFQTLSLEEWTKAAAEEVTNELGICCSK